MKLRTGSVFTGIGLLDLGVTWALEEAGHDVTHAWQCEIDPFCRAVLADNFPTTKRYEDATTIGGRDVAAIDILFAGFPCQDASVAGKRPDDPLSEARTGLWREVVRLLSEMPARPRFVIIENVDRFATRGLDRVVRDLRLLGYRVLARFVSAADVGAPHRRRRLFVVGYAVRARHEGSVPIGNEGRPESAERREGVAEPAHDGRARSETLDSGDSGVDA